MGQNRQVTKHIDTRFEWLKSAVRALILHPMFTRGKSNLSDTGTKCTRKHEFVRAAEMLLGIRTKTDFRLFLKHANTFEEQVTKHLKIDNLAAVCYATDHQGYMRVSAYQPRRWLLHARVLVAGVMLGCSMPEFSSSLFSTPVQHSRWHYFSSTGGETLAQNASVARSLSRFPRTRSLYAHTTLSAHTAHTAHTGGGELTDST